MITAAQLQCFIPVYLGCPDHSLLNLVILEHYYWLINVFSLKLILKNQIKKDVFRFKSAMWIEKVCHKWHTFYQELLTFDSLSTTEWWTSYVEINKM